MATPGTTETTQAPATVRPQPSVTEAPFVAKNLPGPCADYLSPAAADVLSEVEPVDMESAPGLEEPGLSLVLACQWFAGDVTGTTALIYTGDPPAAMEFSENAATLTDAPFVWTDGHTPTDWQAEANFETDYLGNPVSNMWTIKYQDGYLLSIRTSNLDATPIRDAFTEAVYG